MKMSYNDKQSSSSDSDYLYEIYLSDDDDCRSSGLNGASPLSPSPSTTTTVLCPECHGSGLIRKRDDARGHYCHSRLPETSNVDRSNKRKRPERSSQYCSPSQSQSQSQHAKEPIFLPLSRHTYHYYPLYDPSASSSYRNAATSSWPKSGINVSEDPSSSRLTKSVDRHGCPPSSSRLRSTDRYRHDYPAYSSRPKYVSDYDYPSSSLQRPKSRDHNIDYPSSSSARLKSTDGHSHRRHHHCASSYRSGSTENASDRKGKQHVGRSRSVRNHSRVEGAPTSVSGLRGYEYDPDMYIADDDDEDDTYDMNDYDLYEDEDGADYTSSSHREPSSTSSDSSLERFMQQMRKRRRANAEELNIASYRK